MARLASKTAIITGAGSGIGRGIAEEYAGEGANVVLVDVNEEGARQTKANIDGAGGTARCYGKTDVTDYDAMKEVRDQAVNDFGTLDVMVNNAAIVIYDNLLDSTLEDWRKVIEVDLEAVYMGSKLAAEVMAGQNSGRIISTSSIQSFMTTSQVGAYNAAKAGVVGLTKSMAVELAPYNILVNAIAPGAIKTGMSVMEDGTDETETEDFKENYLAKRRIPLGRAGVPRDIAGTALFLASDDCRYMTGQLLIVDGGYSLTL
ncbi:MAG: SDR family oxidoreductase [Planctomycetota bacterium]|jgi:3-oxoacyl-[acyl-carrier protein] reductase|nr:SDR family oxidoreductase [Planctomycetota bacterium]